MECDSVRLAVHRSGKGAPLICLSAISHDAGDFDALAERISDRFELIAIEWPGHGSSGADLMPASPNRYADLLVNCLDQMGIGRPLVLGNSIGGAVAILYASRRPVRGLVLCSSGGLVELTPAVLRITRLLQAFYSAGERGAWWFGALFWLQYHFILTERAAAGQRRRIIANGRKMAGILKQAWTSFGQTSADLRDVAADLAVPIWAAWAEKEITIPLRYCLPAIQRFQRGSLTTFRCGHAPFLECPDRFSREFLSFADSLQ